MNRLGYKAKFRITANYNVTQNRSYKYKIGVTKHVRWPSEAGISSNFVFPRFVFHVKIIH